VSNAIKFTPKGGTVSVDAGLRGSSVVITVRDSGEGIDPAFLPAIFEPFRQADASTTRRHGGLGLGLAIVRQLVHAHGGKVEAASEGKGHGSTFTVALPARTSERTPERAAAPASITLDGMRILVVDDQQDAVELLAFILAGAGASVASARSAEEALETLIDYRPDVLVSDIGMPDVDGYALIRRVRTLGAMSGGDTPAVALTAYAAAEDAERCLAAGFQTHLAKPVDADQLVAAVASVGSLRRR
jgi:CheY-like chemotaxis protein